MMTKEIKIKVNKKIKTLSKFWAPPDKTFCIRVGTVESIMNEHQTTTQSEVLRPIPRNSVESDLGSTSRLFFENAGDNVTLTL